MTIEVAEDRRADAMVWSPGSGTPLAIELQHSRIAVLDLERRAHSFARAGIAQLWVPFLDESSLQRAEITRSETVTIDRYPIPFHMLWMAGLVGDEGLWMYQPGARKFWRARFTRRGWRHFP